MAMDYPALFHNNAEVLPFHRGFTNPENSDSARLEGIILCSDGIVVQDLFDGIAVGPHSVDRDIIEWKVEMTASCYYKASAIERDSRGSAHMNPRNIQLSSCKVNYVFVCGHC